MTILALEFSSERRSVAVLQTGAVGGKPEPAVASTLSSPRRLNAFALIQSALQQAGLEREAINCIAVGLGPGSYTGIRAAISIAQGWELARGVRVLGLNSVEAMAIQAQAEGIRGRLSFVIDAQRGEFYLASYEFGLESFRVIEPLRLVSMLEATERAKRDPFAGPEADRWFPGARVLYPDAGALARLAAGREDFVSAERLEPIYLRETSFVKAPPARS